MTEAVFWGLVAGSSLVIGALVAVVSRPPVRVVGLIMAFGAGTLISAVAYDLIGGAIAEGDSGGIAIGLLLGSIVFFAGDSFVSSRGGHSRKSSQPNREASDEGGAEESGTAIVLGTVLDGVPESFVMGLALIEGGGAALGLIVAVFLSNLPEAIGATSSLARSGWETSRIMVMWVGIALVSALSCALGYAFFKSASGLTGARVEAFAAGAIIAMLASTMMPEAYRSAGRAVGVVTAFGFALGVGMTAV